MRELLILASASPRRRELLAAAGIPHEVVPPGAGVEAAAGAAAAGPREFVLAAARAKAQDVARRFPERLVLGADTVIALEGEVLGKPGAPARTAAMLARLSGRTHEVLTGVVLARLAPAWSREAVVCSAVTFKVLAPEAIARYAAGGEGDDKAGGYALQCAGGALIARTEGSVANVIGLPVETVLALLAEAPEA